MSICNLLRQLSHFKEQSVLRKSMVYRFAVFSSEHHCWGGKDVQILSGICFYSRNLPNNTNAHTIYGIIQLEIMKWKLRICK